MEAWEAIVQISKIDLYGRKAENKNQTFQTYLLTLLKLGQVQSCADKALDENVGAGG